MLQVSKEVPLDRKKEVPAGQPPPINSNVIIIQSRIVYTALSESHGCCINLLLIRFFDVLVFNI